MASCRLPGQLLPPLGKWRVAFARIEAFPLPCRLALRCHFLKWYAAPVKPKFISLTLPPAHESFFSLGMNEKTI
jgi:hypothetical protein